MFHRKLKPVNLSEWEERRGENLGEEGPEAPVQRGPSHRYPPERGRTPRGITPSIGKGHLNARVWATAASVHETPFLTRSTILQDSAFSHDPSLEAASPLNLRPGSEWPSLHRTLHRLELLQSPFPTWIPKLNEAQGKSTGVIRTDWPTRTGFSRFSTSILLLP